MNITKHDRMLMNKLVLVLLFSCTLISSVVMAEEEVAIPADTPDKNVELMQQAADGEGQGTQGGGQGRLAVAVAAEKDAAEDAGAAK